MRWLNVPNFLRSSEPSIEQGERVDNGNEEKFHTGDTFFFWLPPIRDQVPDVHQQWGNGLVNLIERYRKLSPLIRQLLYCFKISTEILRKLFILTETTSLSDRSQGSPSTYERDGRTRMYRWRWTCSLLFRFMRQLVSFLGSNSQLDLLSFTVLYLPSLLLFSTFSSSPSLFSLTFNMLILPVTWCHYRYWSYITYLKFNKQYLARR